MWITILETRKEGAEMFTRGEVRYVTHAFGAAAIEAGWAGDTYDHSLYLVGRSQADPAPVTLQIQSGSLGFFDSMRG